MSILKIYLYGLDQTVIIPTVAETEEGMLLEVEPIEIFKVTQVQKWKNYILSSLESDTRVIKGKDQTGNPGSAILERLNILKWSDFEKHSVMYVIHRGGKFISVYSTGKNEEGMWTQGKSHRTFHPKAPLDIVVNEMALDLVKEPEAIAKQPRLLLG